MNKFTSCTATIIDVQRTVINGEPFLRITLENVTDVETGTILCKKEVSFKNMKRFQSVLGKKFSPDMKYDLLDLQLEFDRSIVKAGEMYLRYPNQPEAEAELREDDAVIHNWTLFRIPKENRELFKKYEDYVGEDTSTTDLPDGVTEDGVIAEVASEKAAKK